MSILPRVQAILAIFSLFVLCGAATPTETAQPMHADQLAGQKLFEQVWEHNDGAETEGDGLGPMFNERSCVACHFQGGVGGGGPNSKNVMLLTVAPVPRGAAQAAAEANATKEAAARAQAPSSELNPYARRSTAKAKPRARPAGQAATSNAPSDDAQKPISGRSASISELETLQREGAAKQTEATRDATIQGPAQVLGVAQAAAATRSFQLHPGFQRSATIVLHKFSTRGAEYQTFLDNLIGIDPEYVADPIRQAGLKRRVIDREGEGPGRVIEVEGTILQISERNTPPLFGIGLISQISKADIEEVAREQALGNWGVHGRVLGRFGWRGQTADLSGFVRGACAVELGLQVKDHPQAPDPTVTPVPSKQRLRKSALSRQKIDLTDGQCDELTQFVSNLPAPGRLKPADRVQAASAQRGSQAFENVGCAVCHRPTLGPAKGIYSDLLVHDMGLAMIDPAPAPLREPPPGSSARSISSSGYNGGSGSPILSQKQLAARQHWKTPPLWGLHNSGPYLHDGRAATIDAAILAHGGEADDSLRLYKSLPQEEQADLLSFLDTLAAPESVGAPQPGDIRLSLVPR